MESAQRIARVVPITSKHCIEAAFRRSLQQHRKAPTLAGLSNLISDLSVARFVADSDTLRDIADAAVWELALLEQGISEVDYAVRQYEVAGA